MNAGTDQEFVFSRSRRTCNYGTARAVVECVRGRSLSLPFTSCAAQLHGDEETQKATAVLSKECLYQLQGHL